jgi:diguanylate cyclase (GGDEF)-like protein
LQQWTAGSLMNKYRLARFTIFLVWLISLVAFPALATADDSVGTNVLAPVTIGVVADDKPYSFFEDRVAAGFSIDILREVSANSGLNFQFRAGTWSEIYSAFMRGELDAIDGISYQQDRADKILFTRPYHVRQTYLMQDSTNPIGHIASVADLKNLRIGIIDNAYFRNLLVDNGVAVSDYDSSASQVRALAFGWVDAIIGPQLSLDYQASKAGFRSLEIAGPAPLGRFAVEDFRIGVQKHKPDLFQKIEAGLDAIPDVKKKELLERWQALGGANIAEIPSFTLNSDQRQFLAELGPVRIGLISDYAPFSFRDNGKFQGLTIDILNRLKDLTGLQVVPVGGHWSELLSMLREGDIDVLSNMSINQDRLAFTEFTQPYYTIPEVAFSTDKTLRVRDLSDLEGYQVGLGSNIYYEDSVTRVLAPNTHTYTTQEEMYRALADGQVEVILAALPNGNFWIRKLGISGVHIAGELSLAGRRGEDLRFGTRKSLAPLAIILDQALAAISPTEKRTIEDRWMGVASNYDLNTDDTPNHGKVRFSPTEQAWLDKRQHQISYCMDNEWLPLEGLDNSKHHAGLSAEVLRLFRERSMIRFQRVATKSWAESLEAAKNRTCDLLSMAMKTPGRVQYLNFTAPYLQIPNIILGRINSPYIESVDDLRGRPVGIVRGYSFAELLSARHPDIKLVEVNNEAEGMRLLQDGRLAGFITTLATASYSMQKLGLADLKVIGRIPEDWSVSIATRNDEPVLLGIMQKLVASITPEDHRNLENGWRNIRIDQPVNYSLIWQLLAIGIFAASLLIYWNRKLGRLNRDLESANQALAQLSVTDNLTQLGNRSYFDSEFRKSFQWCQRHATGFAVAMIDIDLFKTINDTYGHEAGDVCLKALADMMKRHFRRETDRLSRFGGEEFVIFTSYDDEQDTIKRLDDFRKAVEGKCTACAQRDVQLTLSIGLATGVPRTEDSPEHFLRLADQALYIAKQNGRNCLQHLNAEQ